MTISVPAGGYSTPLDIAIAACAHLGVPPITSFTQDAKAARALSNRYDKVRLYEMRRNLWRFTIKTAPLRPINTQMSGAAAVNGGWTMRFTPGAWNTAKTYLPGSIASYGGLIWQAITAVPAGTEPDQNPTNWQEYFGPMVANPWTSTTQGGPQLWVSSTNYAAGNDVVGSDGNQYLSLSNGNLGNNPVTDGGVHWESVGVAPISDGYYAGEIVYTPVGASPGVYLSLVNNNSAQPGVTPAWVSTGNYSSGQTVTGSDSAVYQSLIDLNININPVGDGGVHWAAVPATQTDTPDGSGWLQLGAATVSALNFLYPLGSGPSSQTTTLNVYELPNGFLREAPQDPKAGSVSFLGGPAFNVYDDFVIQDNYILTRYVNPVVFRFGADVKNVARYDPMFCELFAARLALETCEEITQANDKKQTIGAEYQRWGSEARLVNGIETGSTFPAEDEYISVRI